MSIRYMVALLNAPPIRSSEWGYMDCGFPAALVSRVILRSVRRARTAFWQFSRLPRRPYSGRPEPPTRPLTHNHHPPSPGRHPWFTRSSRVFPLDSSLRCTTVPLPVHAPPPLYPQASRDPQMTPRQGDLDRARRSASSGHVYSAFDTCHSAARDGHSVRR